MPGTGRAPMRGASRAGVVVLFGDRGTVYRAVKKNLIRPGQLNTAADIIPRIHLFLNRVHLGFHDQRNCQSNDKTYHAGSYYDSQGG